ncbi:MAG: hypothetical protein WCF84_16715 [Anaerolineae bacterium]
MPRIHLFILFLIPFLFAACAAPSPTPSRTRAAPTASSVMPATSVAPSPAQTVAEATSTRQPTLVRSANLPLTPFPPEGITCGAIRLDRGGPQPLSPNAASIENCFADAVQQCQKATLVLTVIDPDEGILHTFTTQKAPNRCDVVDSVQHYNFYTQATTKHIYTCDDFARQANGLIFVTCGDENDILLPATLP